MQAKAGDDSMHNMHNPFLVLTDVGIWFALALHSLHFLPLSEAETACQKWGGGRCS